jgi:DNA-binding MarR family transcriptional regulator
MDKHPRDSIAVFLDEWRRERPDLDPAPLGLLGRLIRLSTLAQARAGVWLAPLGLTWETFSVIVALRRAGPPYEARPTDLYKQSLLSSGAMTNRLDRVEAQGWIERRPDPADRRAIIVKLTRSGRLLADRAIKLHFESLAEFFAPLGVRDARALELLLAELLQAIETGETDAGKGG